MVCLKLKMDCDGSALEDAHGSYAYLLPTQLVALVFQQLRCSASTCAAVSCIDTMTLHVFIAC